MASYIQGYDEERFVSTVNRNFLCLICFNVLREPVLCQRNQHYFCRSCIAKYLETAQRCPTCADELTVETLAEPPRMVKDLLDELNIHCQYINRGCQEIAQLQHLDRHEATCGFTPVVCTNQGCGVTVSKRDLVHHESDLCEFRKLKCHSCGEMSKTLADMEKRMANMEMGLVSMETNMKKNVANVEGNMAGIKTEMKGKLEAVNNEVRGLKTALVEGFDQMKEVLVKMEEMKEEIKREVRAKPSGDREKGNIIVAGGRETDSVEMFNWRQRTWSPLQSLPKKRCGAPSFVYNNHVTIAGGYCDDSAGYVDNAIRMNIVSNPDLSTHWSECPFKLPAKLGFYSSVVYNDQLIVTGGSNGITVSDCIHEVQLVPPYNVKTLSRMPERRQHHSTEKIDVNIFIVGGMTSLYYQDNLNSVVLYDVKKNECKQLAPLPYAVSCMATVRWGDNIVVIGGVDNRGEASDTVVMYNVKTEQSHMLPRMRCKREGCAAVVIGDNIVVLGGRSELGYLKSVEAFNFDRNTWEELPEMSEARWQHTAAVV